MSPWTKDQGPKHVDMPFNCMVEGQAPTGILFGAKLLSRVGLPLRIYLILLGSDLQGRKHKDNVRAYYLSYVEKHPEVVCAGCAFMVMGGVST